MSRGLRIGSRVLGFGAAGVAAVFAISPFTNAQGSPTPKPSHPAEGFLPGPQAEVSTTVTLDPSVTSTSADPSETTTSADPSVTSTSADPSETTTSADPSETTTGPVEPNYGYQKFRVGVQIKDGSWVPDGTTTAGSEVTIVETGPGVDGGSETSTCNTVADTQEAGSTETYCKFDQPSLRSAARNRGPSIDGLFFDDYYYAQPGDTVTLTQTTVEPNLVIDPVSQTVEPVDVSECECTPITGPVTFNDPGLPPVAVDDSATTKVGVPVKIDVLGNDNSKGAPTTIQVTSQPSHGSAKVTGQEESNAKFARHASSVQTLYSPDAGYTGVDVFHYRLTTANGTSDAKVTITIKADGATSTSSSPSSSSSNEPTSVTSSPAVSPSSGTEPLAVTGVPTALLGEIGAGLVVAGGLATVVGRRRRHGRHA